MVSTLEAKKSLALDVLKPLKYYIALGGNLGQHLLDPRWALQESDLDLILLVFPPRTMSTATNILRNQGFVPVSDKPDSMGSYRYKKTLDGVLWEVVVSIRDNRFHQSTSGWLVEM